MTSRAWAQLLLLGAFVGGVGWLGCATTGDPAVDDPGMLPGTKDEKEAGNDPDPSMRPIFEAGFEDTGSPDPTPDGGDTCIDKDDPGSNEATAKKLPDTTDAQNDPIIVKGVLSSAVDVDFYSLKMSDTAGHTIGVDMQVATASTEMCVFIKCLSGSTNFKQCDQGVMTTSAIGDKGCCTAGPGKANPNWSCGGSFQFNDSAQLYIRVKQVGGDKCLPYAISYAF